MLCYLMLTEEAIEKLFSNVNIVDCKFLKETRWHKTNEEMNILQEYNEYFSVLGNVQQYMYFFLLTAW